ncbi:hypothetical protein F183_A07580 [Bryobacterales bacterium F-183]|nr:hypothetical protein F183_A07580 [Bryobacterales bacterium F-183]
MHLLSRRVPLSLAAVSLAFLTSCQKNAATPEPRVVVERQLSLTNAQAEMLPFEVRDGVASNVRIEAVHLSGPKVAVLLLDKDGLARFRTTRRIAAYPALSNPSVEDRFDSGWHALPAAVYSIVTVQSQAEKSESKAAASVVNLRVYTR